MQWTPALNANRWRLDYNWSIDEITLIRGFDECLRDWWESPSNDPIQLSIPILTEQSLNALCDHLMVPRPLNLCKCWIILSSKEGCAYVFRIKHAADAFTTYLSLQQVIDKHGGFLLVILLEILTQILPQILPQILMVRRDGQSGWTCRLVCLDTSSP